MSLQKKSLLGASAMLVKRGRVRQFWCSALAVTSHIATHTTTDSLSLRVLEKLCFNRCISTCCPHCLCCPKNFSRGSWHILTRTHPWHLKQILHKLHKWQHCKKYITHESVLVIYSKTCLPVILSPSLVSPLSSIIPSRTGCSLPFLTHFFPIHQDTIGAPQSATVHGHNIYSVPEQ